MIRWQRLVAESIAIVASILLAFGLDAAWDRHTERREEVEELSRLEAELGANIERFAAEIVGQESLIEHADSLLAILEARADVGGPTTVDDGLLLALLFAPIVEPDRAALDALVSSGRIQLISDRRIREGVASLSARFVDVQAQHARARDFYMDPILPHLSAHADITGLLRSRRIDAERLRREGGFPWTRAGGRTTVPNTVELRNLVAQQRLFAGEALRASREMVDFLEAFLSAVQASTGARGLRGGGRP